MNFFSAAASAAEDSCVFDCKPGGMGILCGISNLDIELSLVFPITLCVCWEEESFTADEEKRASLCKLCPNV